MTNKEKYKQAFSAIHTSDGFSLEVEIMERTAKHHKFKMIAAVAAACVMLVGSATAAYAADVGGIQRTVQIWFNGDQTMATVEFDGNGNYVMEHTGGEGDVQYQGGGGVAYAPDGTEIPLTEEDLMAQITAPNVEYAENGTVWVYWGGQKLDITDKFENDVCYVKLESVDDEEELYMTVKYEGGYATSPHRYVSPREFDGRNHP